MAKPISNLAVVLTANTTKFQEGMEKATQKVRGIRQAVGGTGSVVGRILKIATGGGIVLGIAKIARQAVKDNAQVQAALDASRGKIAQVTSVIASQLAPAIFVVSKGVGELADLIRVNLNTGLVKTIFSGIVATAVFFGTVKAIAAVAKAVSWLITTYKALRNAEIAALALTGPAGWAAIAAGVVVAVGAVAALNVALDDGSTALFQANLQAKALTGGVDGLNSSIKSLQKTAGASTGSFIQGHLSRLATMAIPKPFLPPPPSGSAAFIPSGAASTASISPVVGAIHTQTQALLRDGSRTRKQGSRQIIGIP